MQVRGTTAAASDLENIADYVFEKTPGNAAGLIREICDAEARVRRNAKRRKRAERFLSAQADAFAGANAEEKVGLLSSK